MADLALKFADGGDQYTFSNLQTFRDTFGDAVPATQRMAGLSGGFDQWGSEDAPSAIGTVECTLMLYAASRTAMQAKIDALLKLRYLGVQKLYFQPQGTANERWTYARVNNVSVARSPAKHSDLFQSVRVSFQVADPHWYETETTTVINASGTSTDQVIANNGNAIALAKVKVVPGAGNSCEDPTIKRIVSAVAVDQIDYIGTLTNTDELIMDARQKAVTLNTAAAYSNFSNDHPDWLRLLPGNNTIRVEFTNAGDQAAVTVYHYHTYR